MQSSKIRRGVYKYYFAQDPRRSKPDPKFLFNKFFIIFNFFKFSFFKVIQGIIFWVTYITYKDRNYFYNYLGMSIILKQSYLNVLFCFRDRKDELNGEIFEELFTLTDFMFFKEMFLDYKAVSTVLYAYMDSFHSMSDSL